MRHGRYSAALLTALLLPGCGGNDCPTAPTGGGTPNPTPTPAPIVVTVTAQVANNTALRGIQGLIGGAPTASRRVRVTGGVDVVGGTADVAGVVKFTFTPDGGQPPVTLEKDAFPPGTISENLPFDVFINLDFPLGASTVGTVVVEVTGTDANGGMVDVASSMLPVADSNTKRPASTCVPDDNTLCALQGGRFKATADWTDFDENTGQDLIGEGQRFDDGGWFFFFGATEGPGLDPDTLDVFLQALDRCGNPGFDSFWVFAAATTDVEYTLTVTDTQTNQTRTYHNDLGNVAPAITDTSAFATCP